ncbi:response regulator transcription factor [Brevibacterium aurantiacum]|uniref:Response regulator transcription factor n=1 Tax=Brevibacterium aurantiacum TaxID=273384 RepID=A0A556CMC0_BREAU|nr:response regulator transcription factor [Brevibacterium aurantiacum]TSI18587.1 response regulator transcription factor [Brevibacterium aurantiacum]
MLHSDTTIRVLLVDDDPMVVSGLRSILGNAEDIEVVGTASSGDEALDQVALHFPDLVLMDIQMPGIGGIEATRRLVNSARPPQVVALTSFDTDDHLIQALDAGAAGYLLKDIAPVDLSEALRKVMAGDPFLSPQSLRRLITQSRDNDARRAQQDAAGLMSTLTAKEREVAVLVTRGLLNREVAESLFLSEATVKTHLNRVMVKLDASSRVGVAVIVERSQLAR